MVGAAARICTGVDTNARFQPALCCTLGSTVPRQLILRKANCIFRISPGFFPTSTIKTPPHPPPLPRLLYPPTILNAKRHPLQIRFLLLQNRQGKTRLSKWYVPYDDAEKSSIQATPLPSLLVPPPLPSTLIPMV
jgi:hypothetical protein